MSEGTQPRSDDELTRPDDEGRVSLHPLKLEEALDALLKTPPMPEARERKEKAS